MPLTAKGEKIQSAMKEQYGSEKGESVFYASANKGTITGVDAMEDKPEDCGDSGVIGPIGDVGDVPEGMISELVPEPNLNQPQQYPDASAPPETVDAFDQGGGIVGGAFPQDWGTGWEPTGDASDALPVGVSLDDIQQMNAEKWATWSERPLGPDQK